MSEKQQRLVLSIIDFLNQSIKDGTVKQEDQESMDVASAFGHRFAGIVQALTRFKLISPVHRRGIWRRLIQCTAN